MDQNVEREKSGKGVSWSWNSSIKGPKCEAGRAWELKEVEENVGPEVLLARVESWLGWLRPAGSVLSRDGDHRGSLTVREVVVDGPKTELSSIVETAVLRISKGLPVLNFPAGMVSPLALQVGY